MRLRDTTQQPRYDELARKDQEHKGSFNFLETPLPPRDYYNTRVSIEKRTWPSRSPVRETTRHRLPLCNNILSRNFQHMTNPEGQQRKRATPASYHVTLAYHNDCTENPARAAIDNFANKYRNYQTVMVPKVTVSSGDTYKIVGNSEFATDLRAVTSITTAHNPVYKPHISLD
ncbi:MAG: hypothetical protein ACKPKO_19665 [Candidatus Fonsibacter sp.]